MVTLRDILICFLKRELSDVDNFDYEFTLNDDLIDKHPLLYMYMGVYEHKKLSYNQFINKLIDMLTEPRGLRKEYMYYSSFMFHAMDILYYNNILREIFNYVQQITPYNDCVKCKFKPTCSIYKDFEKSDKYSIEE